MRSNIIGKISPIIDNKFIHISIADETLSIAAAIAKKLQIWPALLFKPNNHEKRI